ncbi:methionine aminotransferase [Desulfospira joergensenii]|uniref:methionine aminotransferase n=1 Tax=Desulfospira joergensenii TaxID=53329 RepID=UPI0003B51F43|nr:methionine aminotransferase [Desulfospira joergensenii]
MKIRSKLPHVGMTIFSRMTNLANENRAINLSQGFPDFDVDPLLIDLVGKYMHQGFNQYAPMPGVQPLREKIAEKQQKMYGANYDADREVTITSGATEALFAAITTVVNKDDEVIIFDPAYDSYGPAVELCGGKPVHVRLAHPGYSIDWDRVKQSISSKTRLIILNSPHNPTGAVLKPEDTAELSKIVEAHDLYILSDEVYEHIIFDGKKHESISGRPDLAARSFVVSSLGKTYHATGWKVGYCLAPENLTEELRKIHQYLTFSTNTPVQMAYAEFLDHEDRYLDLGAFYQKKRDLFASKLKDSRFRIVPCHGSYFQMLDYSDISDLPDMEFSKKLTIEHKVASIPPSVFYRDGDDARVLRFCFAKKDETLEAAALRLCGI